MREKGMEECGEEAEGRERGRGERERWGDESDVKADWKKERWGGESDDEVEWRGAERWRDEREGKLRERW